MVSDDDELDDIINDVHVVREKGFSRFATTTQTLFKVVGVSDLTILDLMGVKNVEEITPTSVKKYTTGDGKATKLDVMDAVRNYFMSKYDVELELGKPLPFEDFVVNKEEIYNAIRTYLTEITERVHKYLTSFNAIIKDFYQANMLTVYSAGFIDMKKQYLTVGVNGLTDAAEFLGIEVNPNDEYKEFANTILETINICNKKDRTRECMFNNEFVPAENLAVKHHNWDKADGYFVSPKHNMYSSYFYNPEDESLSVIDKFKLHGKDYVQYLDGGSALNMNLKEHLSKEQYRQLMKIAAANGTNYFTFNVRNTVCNDCGYISKDTLDKCPKCGSTKINYQTRIIGYLKRVKDFSEPRQIEAGNRYYS